jgi:ribosome maturation factor RimP
MAEPTADELAARVRDVVAPAVDAAGVDLLDVEVKGQRGSRVVRLVADADGGLDLDTIATLSREAGDRLDETDVVPGRYTLEVTSPGADRPLRTARDFARNVGRDVRLQLADAADGPGELTGALVGVDDDHLELEVEGAPRRVPLVDVDHGTVVLPW